MARCRKTGRLMSKRQRTNLGIIFGGRSGEHEVSLTSAASVIGALDPDEYQITAIGITKAGKLATAEEVRGMLPAALAERIDLTRSLPERIHRLQLVDSRSESPRSEPVAEIIFPLLHGPYGEDGTVQGLLELADLPYIGCGVLASAVGMDKVVMKRLFLQAGLPTTPFRVITRREAKEPMDAIRRSIEREFGYPLFAKPANLGSSVGVTKIHNAAEFETAVRHAAQFDTKVVMEKGVEGRELECAILGNDDARASVVGEVISAHEFYDYAAKYHAPGSRLEIPARIPEPMAQEVRDMAVRAFKAIDGSGLARVDFFLDGVENRILINEINTMPGFTPISMYAKLWNATGIDFQTLMRRLVDLGLERYRERRENLMSAEGG